MFKKHRPQYLLVVVALLLSSCTPIYPEQPYIPVETIVAATYAAISAQTAAARPPNTATPLPPTATRPPATSSPTPTSTFVINLASITPSSTPTTTAEPTATNVTSGSGTVLYSCNILSLSPANVYRVKANESFNWVWQVENIGTTTWDPASVKVVYADGTQLSNQNRYPLKDRTKPGQNTLFTIKMHAPSEPGAYTTTWSMRKDIHTFCYVKLEIEVFK